MKGTKKIFSLLLLCLTLLLVLANCNTYSKATTIDRSKISSITIKTIQTPPKYKIINKSEDINMILDFINELNLKDTKQEDIKGWQFLISIDGEENHSISIISNKISINGKWYEIDKNKLDTLHKIYNELNYEEKSVV